MSVSSKLDVKGLARDPSAFVSDSAGLLRRAEHVVIRSEGVAESRPNFDILREDRASTTYPRSLYEFNGSVISIESDGDFLNWTANSEIGTLTPPIAGAWQPPNYDPIETSFAQGRGNAYLTGLFGPLVIENVSTNPRLPGVEMVPVTDWHGADLTFTQLFVGFDPALYNDVIPIADQVQSVAYRFVFVKKDSNGYIRRSPPSYELVTTCIPVINGWGRGTRFYIPHYTTGFSALPALTEGDQVEFYRTRAVAQGSIREDVDPAAPSPFYYLAFIYTITAADAAAGYFAPPVDTTPEDALGAELYTNSSQTGAISAKYAPPVASCLAAFGRCMWYGNTASKHRTVDIEVKNLFRAGVMRNVCRGAPALAADTIELDRVVDTLRVGMLFTDNFKYGPTVNGAVIAANTVITKIETIAGPPAYTKLTLSNTNLTGGLPNPPLFGTMDALAPQGLIAEKTGNGTYTSGSKVVTSLTSTAGWRAGMYWTDCTSGPSLDGAKVTNQTLIQSVDSATQITMSQVARASGTVDAFVGDTLTIAGLRLYAWVEFYGASHDLTSNTMLTPWSGDYPYCFPIHDARYGDWARLVAVACICQWVNYFAATLGAKALPNGWLPTSDFTIPPASVYTTPAKLGDLLWLGPAGTSPLTNQLAPLGHIPYPLGCTGFIVEEVGVGGGGATVSSSCPTAFTPTLDVTTTNDRRANRIFFSDLDEPESVPILNYIDVGMLNEPIQSLVTLRDCLLVFKTDGLWRITGSGPSQWSVEQVDTTLRLVSPQSVAVMNGTAYAWCDRGFFAVDESSATSLSANAIDTELRAAAAFVLNQPRSHGVFVATHRQRNFVLLGVPDGNLADHCAKVYCHSVTTGQWSEWPVAWNTACSAFYGDKVYVARNEQSVGLAVAVAAEIRSSIDPRGYDREYDGVSMDFSDGTTVAVTVADAGPWIPAIGDFVGVLSGDFLTIYRRVLAVSYVVDSDHIIIGYSMTIEAPIADGGGVVDGDVTGFAREGAVIKMEWHPAAPSGAPAGAVCREIQPQVDLRDGAQVTVVTSPRHVGGGSSELSPTLYTNVSNKSRRLSTQPIRFGLSRQIARGANVAPYLETSDIFPIRVVGMSVVFEGTSEKTTR